VRNPDLAKAFEAWKIAGHARYTLTKIKSWQQCAERISRHKNPAKALVEYWAIDKRFGALEEDVVKAVIAYDVLACALRSGQRSGSNPSR
jgi:hypothetical protein